MFTVVLFSSRNSCCDIRKKIWNGVLPHFCRENINMYTDFEDKRLDKVCCRDKLYQPYI